MADVLFRAFGRGVEVIFCEVKSSTTRRLVVPTTIAVRWVSRGGGAPPSSRFRSRSHVSGTSTRRQAHSGEGGASRRRSYRRVRGEAGAGNLHHRAVVRGPGGGSARGAAKGQPQHEGGVSPGTSSSAATVSLPSSRNDSGRRRFPFPSFSVSPLYLPGGRTPLLSSPVLTFIGWRIPPYILLAYLLILSPDADLHPYSPCPLRFESARGPSMLPTFTPYGDILIRDCMSHRLPAQFRREWRVGDVVAFVDYKGEMACKRIVAVEGGEVQRYGEFAEDMFEEKNEGGRWGIADPKELGVRRPELLPDPRSWDRGSSATKGKDGEEVQRTITVPEGHVWLEGDCPELSVDSRHYGPVLVSRMRGRIVARAWPLSWRTKGETSLFLSGDRPRPMRVDDLVRDERFNLRFVGKT